MATGKTLDPAIMAQLTGSETFYRYGLAGDALFTQGLKSPYDDQRKLDRQEDR